jgi:hypothetical protein
MTDATKPLPVQPIELRYADAPDRDGLVLEPTEDGVRITLPEIQFNPANFFATIIILFLFVVVMSITIWWPILFWLYEFLQIIRKNPLVFLPGALALIFGLWAVPKTMRRPPIPRTIEVTAEALIFTNVMIEEEQTIITRPRREIYDVRYVSHSGNLVVHCHKMNMVECRPVRDPIVMKWIAAVLREALCLQTAPTTETPPSVV